jgi:hypothetical protein
LKDKVKGKDNGYSKNSVNWWYYKEKEKQLQNQEDGKNIEERRTKRVFTNLPLTSLFDSASNPGNVPIMS